KLESNAAMRHHARRGVDQFAGLLQAGADDVDVDAAPGEFGHRDELEAPDLLALRDSRGEPHALVRAHTPSRRVGGGTIAGWAGRRRGRVTDQARQPRHDPRDVGRRRLRPAPCDDLLHEFRAGDEGVHAFVREPRLAVAQGAQIALHLVRELFGLAHPDHARYAFERVKAAEELVERRAVDARLVDGLLKQEQVAACGGQVLVTLLEVIVEELSEKFTVGLWLGNRHSKILIAFRPAIRARAPTGHSAERAWSSRSLRRLRAR